MSNKSLNMGVILHKKYPDSVQPGIPKLKSLKDNWVRVRIGDLFDEVSRPIKMEDNKDYMLVTVKRSRGGAVLRDIKKGKEISVKSQSIVKEGDFLISKRQIVHGACAFITKELDGAIVSNEYSILKCRDNLDSTFLLYLSHSKYFQQTCFHSSIGVHIEKMIFKLHEWFRWKIDIPQLEEQRKIASILRTVDEKISKLQQKLELLEAYKRGVMQKLFSQELRFKREDGSSFPDWEEKELGEILTYEQPTKYIVDSTEYNDSFEIPVLTAGKSFILGYTNESHNVYEEFPVIIFDDFTTSNKFVNFRFKVKSSAMKILKTREKNTNIKLVYEFMQMLKFPLGEHKRYWISEYQLLSLPMPCKEEQQKIADFLSSIDNKIDAVKEQITLTETFKQGLLQQMFI